MATFVGLWVVAQLLATAALAVVIGRFRAATPVVYGLSFAACLVALGSAASYLVGGAAGSQELILPVGPPGLGSHFRVDALAAFFLVVTNLGGAAASLYALGYVRHETQPMRVLPFFPAYLAGMNLVVLADDAFTFLLSWEFMSLTSWALVVAHHREPGNARAGYIYLVMASFGTLSLLLAFGLLAGPDASYAFAAIRAAHPGPTAAAMSGVSMTPVPEST